MNLQPLNDYFNTITTPTLVSEALDDACFQLALFVAKHNNDDNVVMPVNVHDAIYYLRAMRDLLKQCDNNEDEA